MSAVYLIRHGQASFGAADYDRLSERGEQQARETQGVLDLQTRAQHAVTPMADTAL